VCVFLRAFLNSPFSLRVYMCVYIYIYIYIYIFIYLYIYVYIFIYTHTYICIYKVAIYIYIAAFSCCFLFHFGLTRSKIITHRFIEKTKRKITE